MFELFCSCDYSQQVYTASGVRLRRIQHINLNAFNLDAMVEFMTAVLGFRISDHAYGGGQLVLVFLRYEADHHTAGVGRGADGLFHVALEVDSMSELARLGDALDREGRRFVSEPGRPRRRRQRDLSHGSVGSPDRGILGYAAHRR